MNSLWEWAASPGNRMDAEALDGPWRWLVSGGRPPKRDARAASAALYCTGHADGTVRLWDTQVRLHVARRHWRQPPRTLQRRVQRCWMAAWMPGRANGPPREKS